jgi:hypothetical protein
LINENSFLGFFIRQTCFFAESAESGGCFVESGKLKNKGVLNAFQHAFGFVFVLPIQKRMLAPAIKLAPGIG